MWFGQCVENGNAVDFSENQYKCSCGTNGYEGYYYYPQDIAYNISICNHQDQLFGQCVNVFGQYKDNREIFCMIRGKQHVINLFDKTITNIYEMKTSNQGSYFSYYKSYSLLISLLYKIRNFMGAQSVQAMSSDDDVDHKNLVDNVNTNLNSFIDKSISEYDVTDAKFKFSYYESSVNSWLYFYFMYHDIIQQKSLYGGYTNLLNVVKTHHIGNFQNNIINEMHLIIFGNTSFKYYKFMTTDGLDRLLITLGIKNNVEDIHIISEQLHYGLLKIRYDVRHNDIIYTYEVDDNLFGIYVDNYLQDDGIINNNIVDNDISNHNHSNYKEDSVEKQLLLNDIKAMFDKFK